LRYSLLGAYVAEHIQLLLVVSSHAFFLSGCAVETRERRGTELVFARIVLIAVSLAEMLKLLAGLLVAVALFFRVMGLIRSSSDWKLWPTIRRAKREVNKLARQRCPNAKVFSFGATDIDPRHLAIWITTNTDEQRDRLRQDSLLHQQLRDALLQAGYPPAAVPLVSFAFESRETVDRDFGGNWYYATK
jgi:hypothetical protein